MSEEKKCGCGCRSNIIGSYAGCPIHDPNVYGFDVLEYNRKILENQDKACDNFFSDPFVNEWKCLNCNKMLSEHKSNKK